MLNTSVERLEGSKVKLTVTVPSEDVDRTVDATYKSLGKKYRFPGFRPGKAPRPILEQQLGRDYILGEATETIVNESYSKALDLEQLRPIESPEIEGLDVVVPGEEYTYEAEIEVRPELELSDYEGFEIALPTREATHDEIDAQLEVARERFASLEPVEDRGIDPSDYVLLSFKGTVDGEGYEGNEVDKYLYEMGHGLMPAEFDSGIVGAKPGEERHVEFEIPETSSNPEYVGKTAGFDITIHEIKAKVLPEVDDEFATNVGGFDSAEEMIADLKNRIDLQKGSAHDRLREQKAREALAEKLQGEVPEAMTVSRQQTMMRDFLNMLESREMPIDQYLAASGIDMDTLEADIKAQAIQSIREELALEALFRAKGMEVVDEDIDAELREIASSTETSPEDARKRWEELGLMAVIREQIMHRKAINWLLDNITVTELAEETETESPSEGTKKSAPKKAAKSRKKKAEAEPAEAEPESTEAEVAETEE
ncbi:MAG TPA: trigger factor [Coriobacteriia bacterium]|nr:trigger factor [Coriobacteriia bacterium]